MYNSFELNSFKWQECEVKQSNCCKTTTQLLIRIIDNNYNIEEISWQDNNNNNNYNNSTLKNIHLTKFECNVKRKCEFRNLRLLFVQILIKDFHKTCIRNTHIYIRREN